MLHVTLFILLLIVQTFCYGQAWTAKQDIPGASSGRWGAYCFSLDNKIYAGGGYVGNFVNKKDLWQYDPAANSWTQKADVPGSSSRTVAISFVINGKAYVGLGREDFNTGGPFLKDLWEYDPVADSWAQKADLPDSGRGQAACFVVNNKAYVVGGDVNFTYFNSPDVWEYDPANNKWTAKNDFPTGIFYAQAFSIGDKGYVVGGNNNKMTFKATYEYNPAADSWTTKADYCGDGRLGGMSFVLNGEGYVGTGLYESPSNAVYYNEFCKYNPGNNTWAPVWINLPSERTYGIAAVANGKVYAGAGFIYLTSEQYFKDWYELSSATSVNSSGDEQVEFSYYPNPTCEMLNIHATGIPQSTIYLTITDILGKTVQSLMLPVVNGNVKSKLILNGDIANGTYLLKVDAGSIQLVKRLSVSR